MNALNTLAVPRIVQAKEDDTRSHVSAGSMNRTMPDDRPTVGRALADAEAERLDSNALRHSLNRLAYRLLWNRDDAEEATQDALARAHEHRRELRDPRKWTIWVRQILVQRCRALGRRRQLWKRYRDSLPKRDADSAQSFPIESTEAARLMRQLLMKLPERQKQVVVLRFLEGLDYAEIANILNVSSSTCRVHACAALDSLRAAVRRDHPEFMEPGPG